MILTKENCGKLLDKDEVREIQLNMLNDLVDFLKKNNLRYFLSGGTLLGAIRHKGFIPWDDDIDINMPRPDVEKLYELTGGRLGKYIITTGGVNDPFSPACMWFRMYNAEVIIENYYGGNSKKPFYHPIFIDIFPIEGFPKDKIIGMLFSKKLIFIRKMVGVSWHKGIIPKNGSYILKQILTYIPAKLIGYRRWYNLFEKESQKYKFDESEYAGVTTTVQYLPREKVKKEDYLKRVIVSFEGNEYNAPGNYDTYLSNLYGDYMKMPPKEKQKSDHLFKMYKNIKWEEE